MKTGTNRITEMTEFTEMTPEITGMTLKSTKMTLQIHLNGDICLCLSGKCFITKPKKPQVKYLILKSVN